MKAFKIPNKELRRVSNELAKKYLLFPCFSNDNLVLQRHVFHASFHLKYRSDVSDKTALICDLCHFNLGNWGNFLSLN